MRRNDFPSKLLVLHIPKNAGTTFSDIISNNFERIQNIDWNPEKNRHPSKLTKEMMLHNNVFQGHYPYGLHKRLCDNDSYIYITILRDPIRRTVSEYHYMRNDSRYINSRPDLKSYINKLSLAEYVAVSHKNIPTHLYIDNCHVRYLSGVGETKPFGALNNGDLEIAKKNLKSMLFGITEDFDRSMLHFKEKLGLKSIVYIKQRIGSVKKSVLSAEEYDTIVRRNALDMELYKFGLDLYKERTAYISDKDVACYREQLFRYEKYAWISKLYDRISSRFKQLTALLMTGFE